MAQQPEETLMMTVIGAAPERESGATVSRTGANPIGRMSHTAEGEDVQALETGLYAVIGDQRRDQCLRPGFRQDAGKCRMTPSERTQRCADAAAHGVFRQGRDAGGTGNPDAHGAIDPLLVQRCEPVKDWH
jgi:hypothetical protein